MSIVRDKITKREHRLAWGKGQVEKMARENPRQIHILKKGSPELELITSTGELMVYILRCNNYYKIGHTKVGISRRIDYLQMGNPYPIELVLAVLTDKAKVLEIALHEHFKFRHVRGEWFELNLKDFEVLEKFVLRFLGHE